MLIRLYDYFKAHRLVFYLFSGVVFVTLAGLAVQIRVEEDVSRFFPQDERIERLNTVLKNSRFADRLVFMLSAKDPDQRMEPDSLLQWGESFASTLRNEPHLKDISFRINEETSQKLVDLIYEHLPLFLEASDYQRFDSLLESDAIDRALLKNFRTIASPAGVALRPFLSKDPLGLARPVWERLQELQVSGEYVLYDNVVFSKDMTHLVFFVRPDYSPSETNTSRELFERLNGLLDKTAGQHPEMKVHYFGAHAVAAGNAERIHQDTQITIGLMVAFLIGFLAFFFRRKRTPLILLLPVAGGCLFGLAMMFLIQGSISILALASGAIVLGVAIDYSLHFISYYHYQPDPREVIRELIFPLTIGSATTVLAFFALQFVNAGVLKDFGLFAGMTLIGAALCTLVFLPHLMRPGFFNSSPRRMTAIASFRPDQRGWLVLLILLLTPVLLYFAFQVRFNSDMNQLSYMPEYLKESERELNDLNKAGIKSIFVISEGNTLDEALDHSRLAQMKLEELKSSGILSHFSHLTSFYPSVKIQEERILRWNDYWGHHPSGKLLAQLQISGSKVGFSVRAFDDFQHMLEMPRRVMPIQTFQLFRDNLFQDNLVEKEGRVLAVLMTQANDRSQVYEKLAGITGTEVADRQLVTSRLVGLINQDFNFIVTATSIIVFLALLLAYGRIELTLITFIPMLITWIWILGIMGLLGIEFNIVNVIVSTFIFGLGDDYSLFIMDGLQKKYRYGKDHLPSVRVSIFLSAVSTVAGLGVLIFAKHPALRSIAAISIIGIACVVVMSQTLEPFLFRQMISGPASRGRAPRRALETMKSFVPYIYFVAGSMVLTVVGFVMLRVWPFSKERVKVSFHFLMSKVTGWIFPLSMSGKKVVIGMNDSTFSRPAVIIANHQSILDILSTVSLHPKILLVTNTWVWNSPVFGFVVRMAEYYPVTDDTESNISKMRERVNQGYSILIFPEGTRSPDEKMKRFHKGAFLMAEQLGIDIQPLLIHGSGNLIPKGELYVDVGTMVLKFLPRISSDDQRFGTHYAERTKKISAYFRQEYEKLALERETPRYFARKLISNYLYKGPVLEWYLRVKLRLEDYYAPFDRLVPRNASVLDLGCGYGFLCYMLHFLSESRQITGIDYDEDKIETANHCYSKSASMHFEHADIKLLELKPHDVILINDVLHYLSHEEQENLLVRCFTTMNPGGKIIVRDGDKDLGQKHKGTQLSEFFSVKLLGFNKSTQDLSFVSGKALRALAERHGFEIETTDDARLTSNVIFVLTKKAIG